MKTIAREAEENPDVLHDAPHHDLRPPARRELAAAKTPSCAGKKKP
ncbi:MAG: hypothetical protein MZU95_01970 [Desulfomicrobium escambiense]|nr:hypothetical protein [Desulfomicrobium escambiense]